MMRARRKKRRWRQKKGALFAAGVFCLAGLGLSVGIVLAAVRQTDARTAEENALRTEDTERRTEAEEAPLALSAEEYYEEELALDDDADNVLYEEEDEEASEDTYYPYYIKVNRQANCVTVYGLDENGEYTVPVKAMVCSVGLNGNTPTGIFQTSTKYLWRALYGGVYGQYAYRITGAILFHSVPYYTQDKGDLETEEYNKLGEAASLGCVRLSVADAKWLVDNCPQGTTVEIYDSPDPGPLGKPTAITIDPDSPYRGWDPTDPDENNPWRNYEPSADATESEKEDGSSGSAPVLSGVADRTVERGETVDLLSGVSAVDSAGNALQVSVDGTVDTQTVGSYSVTYSATDGNGRVASASATVTVCDTTKPVVTVQAGITVDDTTASVENLILSYVTAKDGNDVLNASAVTLQISALTAAIGGNAYGDYSCSCTAKDAAGNVSDPVSFTVSYKDVTAPVISVGTVEAVTLSAGSTEENAKDAACARVKEAVTATDASGNVTVSCEAVSAAAGTDENGALVSVSVTVRVTAVDGAGNSASTDVSVNVSVESDSSINDANESD